MLNLIKMNMYRMRHAVSTWVIAIVTIVFAFMQFGSLKLLLDDPFNMFDAGEGAKMLGFATVGGENLVTTLLHNSNILIIAAVFVVLFANAEHKSGFDKNLIGITNHKWKHALARWISAVIGMTIFIVLGYAVLLSLCALFLDAFSFGSAAAMLKSAGFLYLGMVTFSAIFFFFTTLFKSSAGGIVASLVISLGILNLIEQLLDLAVNKIFSNPAYVPSDFFFDNAYMTFDASGAGMKACVVFVAICLVYLVLSVGGSMLLQQKRDVR